MVHDDEGEPLGIEGIFRDVTQSIRLEREARDRAERLGVINQIANVINSSLEAGRLYESLVVEIKRLVDFDYAALALLNEEKDVFETRRLWPEQEQHPSKFARLDDDTSCAAWVARRQSGLLIDNLREPPSPFAQDFPPRTHSCLCVPLYATGRIIGTLNLGADEPEAFSKHAMEVLDQVAPHVAVAMRNAHLLDNLQRSLEEVTRAQEELHQANEELKTLDEMKTNLLSNVSHELRTPLVSVLGYTDMIYNGKAGPTNEVQREYLSICLRNTEKLVTLIENLLDFSRLHSGDETLVSGSFDLVECARSSVQSVRPVADARQIVLALEPSEEPIVVEGDKGKLGQVFDNLLSNAVKFNHNGGSITLTLDRADGEVDVKVADTGIGIPPEALEKVFTRFYQYDSSSTRQYGGTGIGLAIAQDIIRLHGSRITVTSEVGKGSCFRFSLAVKRVEAREAAAPATAEESERPVDTSLLVEVVTQDRALGDEVRQLLISEGMGTILAAGAAQATALAEKHRPDCILVDIASLGNGRDVLEELLSRPAAPVVLIADDESVYEAYRARVAARAKRPFRKSSLLSTIRFALEGGVLPEEAVGNHILCVDDDDEVLTFMTRCLTAEGYDVSVCDSGEEALQHVATRQFGLVLLDIAMPGIDGWETCRRIKFDPALAEVNVFLVSAKPIDQETRRIQECRADGYLLKPFRSEELLEIVRELDLAANREHA